LAEDIVMLTIFLCFLIGCVAGLRSLTAPAIVCWGAHFGWLHFAGSKLAFIDHTPTLVIFTLLAVGELIADKLPNTPSRTALVGLSARIFTGAACGYALMVSAGANVLVGALAGVVGALAGTFGGYNIRHALVTKAHLPDFAVALAEDILAIGGGLLIVSHF
jgi:uncharacterized membrane protein